MKSLIGVVIPTRNRKHLLRQILEDLNRQTTRPEVVVVVDSSDEPLKIDDFPFVMRIVVLHSIRKSAAHQRNLGINHILENYKKVSIVSFLDDDVSIKNDYLLKVCNALEYDKKLVGISGIAEMPNGEGVSKKSLSQAYIDKHPPGVLTRSVINVSPAELKDFGYVDWLIGCSNWKRFVFDYLRFEDDFEGQSLFEDVIFSYRARNLGKLAVDPQIRFMHYYSSDERPNLKNHYESWIRNRARIFRYAGWDVSKKEFLLMIVATVLKNSFPAVVGHSDSLLKIKGILVGLKKMEF